MTAMPEFTDSPVEKADSNRRSLSQNEPVSLAERECRRGERAISKARSILGETEGSNPISSSRESRANRKPSELRKAEKAPIYAHGDELKAVRRLLGSRHR